MRAPNLVAGPEPCIAPRRPLDEECSCMVCESYTRAYLHSVVRRGLPFAAIALSYRNVAYMQVRARLALTSEVCMHIA